MSLFLTIIIVISAILIVFAVIMQPSKDGGLSGLTSGGVTDSVFGTGRNEFLTKTTWWLLAIFLLSCLVLAKNKTREHNEKELNINTRSALETVETPAAKTPEVKPVDVKPTDVTPPAVVTPPAEVKPEVKAPVAPTTTPEAPKAP